MMDGETQGREEGILIEAESFDDLGGWKLDTQFIHSMGSPYLLAHGLGKPVAPATTRVTLPSAGRWFVWARTKNWVPGPWEAPGRFKLAIDTHELDHVFGAGEGMWNWECGGAVDLVFTEFEISLIDLTGFDGRCDAICFTTLCPSASGHSGIRSGTACSYGKASRGLCQTGSRDERGRSP